MKALDMHLYANSCLYLSICSTGHQIHSLILEWYGTNINDGILEKLKRKGNLLQIGDTKISGSY